MHAYVINLERDAARLARMAARCDAAKIEWERFAAIDGGTVTPLADHVTGDVMSPGATGCLLSHRELWQKVATAQAPALILEDDVDFAVDVLRRIESAAAGLAQWDVLMLECSERAYWPLGDCVFAESDRRADGLVRLGRNRSHLPNYAWNPQVSCIPGARAYAVTPKAAGQLLRYRSAPTDVVLAKAFVGRLTGYAFSPPVAFLEADHDGVSNTAG